MNQIKIEERPGTYQMVSKKTGEVIFESLTSNCSRASVNTFIILHKGIRAGVRVHSSKTLSSHAVKHGVDDLEFVVVKYTGPAKPEKVEPEKVEPEKVEPEKTSKVIPTREVAQYKDGEFIQKYPSASAAAKELEINKSHIYASCNNKRKDAGGFQFKYVERG